MNRIVSNNVQVPAALFERMQEFYCNLLGMTSHVVARDTEAGKVVRYGYGNEACGECDLEVTYSDRIHAESQPLPDGPYWKIGLAVDDVDSVAANLKRQGVAVGECSQFRDIGYVCHLRDPAGFTIELLQSTFEDESEARKALIAADPEKKP
eukprot:Hpha_TRINITY_DN32828_c0_g1::TRINITY_DN32828_c0_g1_i1::g.87323::m.87323/K01759/GLO1, gloA; lactoylglutathione lyase